MIKYIEYSKIESFLEPHKNKIRREKKVQVGAAYHSPLFM